MKPHASRIFPVFLAGSHGAEDQAKVVLDRSGPAVIAVDPIILGEVRFGILLLRKGKKRSTLERWFDAGVKRLCLP